jgi:uroporphyrinogen-III synthase
MKTTLYLGTDPSQFEARGNAQGHLIHYPVIKIVPRALHHSEIKQAFDDVHDYTHFIFTSKNAVKIFMDNLKVLQCDVHALTNRTVIAIGEVTAATLCTHGLPPQYTSALETQEGVLQLLKTLNLDNAYIFLPRSSLSRPVLANYFQECQIRYQACDLYDTTAQVIQPKPNLDHVDEIVFTSPSTVKAFIEIFGGVPRGKKCLAIGPITEQALHSSGLQT